MNFTEVGTQAFVTMGLGTVLAVVIPVAIALLWVRKKNEKITTVLVGALTFLVFALLLEKALQALVISIDHPVSRFLNENPVLLALVLGLFPGVFEETGRLVAFKTVLRKRKNKETSISYGIGYGGLEIIALLGMAYVNYITYAVMINTGSFQTMVDQVAAQAPDQVESLYTLADQLAHLTVAGIIPGFMERAFALFFHIGASIIVFYACRDKGRSWLYPLAIALHTLLDFIPGLVSVKLIDLSVWALEAIVAAVGILTFCGAYVLLYRKDTDETWAGA